MTAKKNTLHTIELLPRTFDMLQELKQSFEEMTQGEPISDDDVVNVLVQGFIESTHAHAEASGGCCGGQEKGDETNASCSKSECAC